MATIVTIHGTFATGPEEGSAWWQRGGSFAADVGQFVGAQSGQTHIQPFVWSGANSEAARRRSASKLFGLVSRLEARREPYCLVGHSHGGSLIAHTLSLAALRGEPLPYLGLWATVGSPFMVVKQNSLLFSRLLPFEMLLLSATLVGGLLAFLVFSLWMSWPSIAFDQLTASLVPAAISYGIIWWRDRRRQAYIRDGHSLTVSQQFADRGLCLYHSNDEAINSLVNAPSAKLALFDSRFLTGMSLSVVLALLPILFFTSFAATAEMLAMLLGLPLPNGPSGLDFISRWIQVANHVGAHFTDPFFHRIFGEAWYYNVQLALVVLVFVVGCFGVLLLVGWATQVTSRLLASRLNSIATFHAQQLAYGSDELGATVQQASRSAFGGAMLSRRLPLEIERAIQRIADESAARKIPELRSKLGLLVSLIGQRTETSTAMDFLTWDELIHTSYFAAPQFRKLLCAALAGAKGFIVTERMSEDPQASDLRNWLASEVM